MFGRDPGMQRSKAWAVVAVALPEEGVLVSRFPPRVRRERSR